MYLYRRATIICGLLALLTGCASMTPAERSVRMQQAVDEMIQVYGPACEKLGAKADTDPWRECILKLNHTQHLERIERSDRFNAQMTTTDCWGHRGFFHCSTF